MVPLVACVLFALGGQPVNAEKDLASLQGNWELVTFYRTTGIDDTGKLRKFSPTKPLRWSLNIKDDHWQKSDAGSQTNAKIKLDSTKNPKAIDLEYKGANPYLSRGIYKIERDVLTVHFAVGDGARPRAFDDHDKEEAKGGRLTQIWKRVKPEPKQEDVPTGDPPRLMRASATQKDGKVVIQLATPATRAVGGVVTRPDGTKMLPGETERYWCETQKIELGKSVQAFGISGKPLQPEAVLKTLAEPKGVVVFVRRAGDPAAPHRFYLAMFREGTVILVQDEKDILP